MNKIAQKRIKWAASVVLDAARQRTEAIVKAGGTQRQSSMMLRRLMRESGWNQEEFLGIVAVDCVRKG